MQTAQVIPFSFESQEVRTLLIDDQPWFCATDVCSVLGYVNSRQAIQKNCIAKGVSIRDSLTSGGKQSLTFINEGNLYRLIIKSRKLEAQRFESWVCDEVLPAIRKHGRYEDTSGKMGTLLGETIGTDGFHCLAAVLDGKLRHLPTKARQRAKMHVWSQVHKAFSVVSAEDIPATQLDSARNFIAAYVVPLEGEFLGKEPEPKPVDTLLPEAQAKEINERLNRLIFLFHPFSSPFADAHGIQRALRGLHPKLGMDEPSFRQVLERP